MKLYLDASVLVPLLVSESTSDLVRGRLYGTTDELIVSDLAGAEVSSAISRYVRTGRQTLEDGRALLDLFDGWRLAGTQPFLTISGDLEAADALVRRFELMVRTPDALHLVLARRSGAAFVTFDSLLRRAASTIGLLIVTIPPG